MLAAERHLEILSRIVHGGSVRVAELAESLDVAEETIRRDLEKLDRDGRLLRIHGGALPLVDEAGELPFTMRTVTNEAQKRAIAALAVKRIVPGDVIALDASSTVNELARLIPDMPLTVVTNSLTAIASLRGRPRIRVVCTGGTIDAPSRCFVGSLVERALEQFNINRLFFSSKGVDFSRGLSVVDDNHARVKRCMIELAAQVCLLVDSSKFGVKSVEFFAGLEDVDLLFTDGGAREEIVENLKAFGLSVEQAR